MHENIQNTFIRIIKSPIMLIKGKTGWHTFIKKLSLINKESKTITINIYMLKEDNEKHYLERNILVLPETRLELLDNKSIVLNRKDRLFIESNKETNIDVFCEYVEKSVIVQDINVLMTDQHGNNVEHITYSINDLKNKMYRKLITFDENEDYLILEDIEFEVKDNQIIVFKNNNNNSFDVVSEYGCVETSDKFTVTLFDPTYLSLSNVSNPSSIRVNMVQEEEYWRYISITPTTSGSSSITSEWTEQNIVINIPPGDYEIEFDNLEGFETPNFPFTLLKNNFYDFTFDIDEELTNLSSVTVIKSEFMTENESLGIRWRIDGETNTLNYGDIVEGLEEGTYTIIIEKLDEYFDTITDSINIYDHQRTNYMINNELVRNTKPVIDFIFPEKTTIAIDVFLKPVLSLTVEPSGKDAITDSQWKLIYPSGIEGNWKNNDEQIKVGDEIYQIKFSDVDYYMTPNNYILNLPKTTVDATIKCIYTKIKVSNLEINFIIPNKYSQYLYWCLVKPDDSKEIIVVDWNTDIYYNDNLQNGTYQIKIKEIIFGTTIETNVYDFNTGVIIPNQTLIEEETIDFVLDSNINNDNQIDIDNIWKTTIEKTLITNNNLFIKKTLIDSE